MVIIITDYSPKYHSEVNRIFSEGIMSNVPQALSMSLTFYRFWILMVFTFLLGWIIHSWPFALLLVSCCIGMYCFTVYYCYRQYVRYVHLLIDKNLKGKKKITFSFRRRINQKYLSMHRLQFCDRNKQQYAECLYRKQKLRRC